LELLEQMMVVVECGNPRSLSQSRARFFGNLVPALLTPAAFHDCQPQFHLRTQSHSLVSQLSAPTPSQGSGNAGHNKTNSFSQTARAFIQFPSY